MDWDVRAFDAFAPAYDLLMPSADAVALRKGLYCADRDVERIVEVGGGSGRAAREVDATVLDPARGMLERARRKGLETVQGSAADLPLVDGSVDAVLVVDALHHFPDHARCLSEMARVLAPGGVLVVREFDRSTRRGRLVERAEPLFGFDSQFYTAAELLEAVDAAGLDARPVEYGFEMTVVGVKK
ncbi:class I SAM-dependent methyltransferase [Natronomonas salina]|uniref:class I SAM-dependent methyltransferase n=1 Tax=Natronomonas salina TaxID=1710540 RepID=UPI0015B5DAA0|nr:class I SAM-dependent methyltransferase [Natronomonas salina]QLD88077.1 class I SAM-dependent methyltransferase [Natronomonas salina]